MCDECGYKHDEPENSDMSVSITSTPLEAGGAGRRSVKNLIMKPFKKSGER